MTCFNPNKMFIVGMKDNGKKHLIFTSGSGCEAVSCDVDPKSNRWAKWYKDKVDFNQFIDWNNIRKFNDYLWIEHRPSPIPDRWWSFDYIEVPCGQCSGCRIDRSRQWADRMLLEVGYHAENCFLTLTYNDDNIPESHYTDAWDTVHTSRTLLKRDYQLFTKRLRRYVERDGHAPFRFYACGEYGSQTHRPHYHAIIFGWFPPDAVLDHVSPNGDRFYRSEIVSKAWLHKGFILVSDVSWETCAYVARYVQKKLNGDGAGLYSYLNIEPPFSLSSRRPGIARQFYEDHKDDIYNLDKEDSIYISTPKGGKKIKPPRYFDMLYDIEYPDDMAKIKERRKRLVEGLTLRILKQTDLDKWKYNDVKRRNFEGRIKCLKRDQI